MTEKKAMAPMGASRRSLVERMAGKYNVESAKLLTTLKNTAFRQRDGEVTNEQMMALLIVADQHGLNPFTKEIYAFADRNAGVVPVVGVDGWIRMANRHASCDGWEFHEAADMVVPQGGKRCPEWMEVIVRRKDRDHAVVVREYLDEVYQAPRKYPGPWQTHTKRMLRHKTLIQGFRMAFGFAGIYDEDEAERVLAGATLEGQYQEEQDPGAALAQALTGPQEDAAPVEDEAEGEVKVEEPSTQWVAEEAMRLIDAAKALEDLDVALDLVREITEPELLSRVQSHLDAKVAELEGGKAA